MEFYNATNESGICQKIDRLCDSTDTSYTRKAKTSEVIEAEKEVASEIMKADGTWQFDDTRLTDAPRGKGTLVEGQEYYSFATDYLQIEAIDILDANTLYKRIKPFDPQELNGLSPDEHFGVDGSGDPQTGFPTHYDIKGDSIRLYPAPTSSEVTLANGIRVTFKRNPTAFAYASDTSADTTESYLPVNAQILAFKASIPYCIKYHKDRVVAYKNEIQELLDGIIEHYASREKNKRGIITTKRRSFK